MTDQIEESDLVCDLPKLVTKGCGFGVAGIQSRQIEDGQFADHGRS
jgi:hypothetical protein